MRYRDLAFRATFKKGTSRRQRRVIGRAVEEISRSHQDTVLKDAADAFHHSILFGESFVKVAWDDGDVLKWEATYPTEL